MSTEEKEQQIIEILRRVNELAADAGDAFYDIAGEDLKRWDDIKTLIWSIRTTLDTMVESHAEEKHCR
jgi:hypothetical protein